MTRSSTLIAASLLAALPALVEATSYVLPSDGALADRAELIAHVRVDSVAAARDRTGLEYRVTADRIVKGARTSSLTVRVPGNPQASDGPALQIDGAPRLDAGRRALLFLRANDDGTFRIAHLILGVFVEVASGGRRIGVRDLGDAVALPSARESRARRDLPRDLDRFEAWLSDRAAGVQRPADYFVAAPSAEGGSAELRGPKVRWFRFDGSGPTRFVDWQLDPLGQEGVPDRGLPAFRSALRAWNRLRGSTIDYRPTGPTDADGGLETFDGINAIRFEVDFGEPYDCEGGGVLAIGGAWYEETAHIKFRRKRYSPIIGADIVVNQNISCFFADSPDPRAAAVELFTHELGHTLGLHHSCGDRASGPCRTIEAYEAIMRAFIHDDGRGAFFDQADKDAICTLYPDASLTTAECAAR